MIQTSRDICTGRLAAHILKLKSTTAVLQSQRKMHAQLPAAQLREAAAVSSPGAMACSPSASDAIDRIMHTWAQRVAELEHVIFPFSHANALHVVFNYVTANGRSGGQRKNRDFSKR